MNRHNTRGGAVLGSEKVPVTPPAKAKLSDEMAGGDEHTGIIWN